MAMKRSAQQALLLSAMIGLSSAQTASVASHCDGDATYSLSQDGGNTFGASSSFAKESFGKENGFAVNIADVSASTVVQIVCQMRMTSYSWGEGGFISTVHYNEQSFSTTNPMDAGNWRTTYDSTLQYYYKSDAIYGSISTSRIDANAVWVWNTEQFQFDDDANAVWVWNTEHAEATTMTFQFDFANLFNAETASSQFCASSPTCAIQGNQASSAHSIGWGEMVGTAPQSNVAMDGGVRQLMWLGGLVAILLAIIGSLLCFSICVQPMARQYYGKIHAGNV